MGKAPLDLPDPLHAEPLANARSADDLLSQMAGEEINRLLAQADAENENAGNERGTDASPPGGKTLECAPVEPAPPLHVETPQRETAVSSFVADGDPVLEAELDNLLADQNGAPVELGDSGIVVPPGAMGAKGGEASAGKTEARSDPRIAAEAPHRAASESPAPDAGDRSPAIADGPETAEAGASAATASARTDPLVTRELDQVFDKMTASADPAPAVASPAPAEPAATASSIDLLKVLEPIVAKDAAAVEEAASTQTPDDADAEERPPRGSRMPIHELILEWLNAPLAWLSPAVREAAGKIGILTLINAAAVLLYVLFFRKK